MSGMGVIFLITPFSPLPASLSPTGDVFDSSVPPTESPSARLIGTAAVGTMIFVSCFVVLSDLATLGKDMPMIRKNCTFVKRLIQTCRRKYAAYKAVGGEQNPLKMSREFKGIEFEQMRLEDVD